MKYLYLLLLCLLCACATSSLDTFEANNDCLNNTNIDDPNCRKSTLIKVYADNTLPYEKQVILAAAFDEWSIRTNSRVRFDLVFVPKDELAENRYIKNTYYFFYRNPADTTTIGYCIWSPGLGAVIEIRPDVDISWFKIVALHEIGHALNLQHYSGEYKSIMGPAAGQNGMDISCYDLKTMCAYWDCDVDCELEKLESHDNITPQSFIAIDSEL